jgi:hypothetical protein
MRPGSKGGGTLIGAEGKAGLLNNPLTDHFFSFLSESGGMVVKMMAIVGLMSND